MDREADSTEKLLNVDIDIIEEFLLLIKDKYPLVDYANYFLERHTDSSGVNIAMANQRDFISHFCTILSSPNLKRDEQKAQIVAAEEHLRRAIIESYQKSVDVKIIELNALRRDYIDRVTPNIASRPNLKSAPDLLELDEKIKDIKKLCVEGRKAKGINQWNAEWEKGVKTFILAFRKAEELISTIEKYISLSPPLEIGSSKTDTKAPIKNSIYMVSVGLNILLISSFIIYLIAI